MRDSVGVFQLVAHLESDFWVEIEDEEFVPADFASIGVIARPLRYSSARDQQGKRWSRSEREEDE